MFVSKSISTSIMSIWFLGAGVTPSLQRMPGGTWEALGMLKIRHGASPRFTLKGSFNGDMGSYKDYLDPPMYLNSGPYSLY